MANQILMIYLQQILLIVLYYNHDCNANKTTIRTITQHQHDGSSSEEVPKNKEPIRPHMWTADYILPFVIHARTNHTASLIILHGVGEQADNMYPTFNNLDQPYIKVICPQAHGTRLQAWFNIVNCTEDTEGIKEATKYIHGLINDEIKEGIPPERIMLGGFSQGGALALHCALSFPKRLAGAWGYSTWIPGENGDHTFTYVPVHPANKDIPLLTSKNEFIYRDRVYRDIKPKEYIGFAHPISIFELKDIREFITKHLPENKTLSG